MSSRSRKRKQVPNPFRGIRVSMGHVRQLAEVNQRRSSDVSETISHYKEKLSTSEQQRDSATVEHCCSCLGNLYIYVGEYNLAAIQYLRTLKLARGVEDKQKEGVAFFCLAHCYWLLHDLPTARDYLERHMKLCAGLGDRVGESSSAWSLGQVYHQLGERKNAIACWKKHLKLSKDLGDDQGVQRARALIERYSDSLSSHTSSCEDAAEVSSANESYSNTNEHRSKNKDAIYRVGATSAMNVQPIAQEQDELENVFDQVQVLQTRRMNEQRSRVPVHNTQHSVAVDCDELMDLLVKYQDSRLEEQRAPPSALNLHHKEMEWLMPAIQRGKRDRESNNSNLEELFNQLVLAQNKFRRIDDQRCALSPLSSRTSLTRAISQSRDVRPNEDLLGFILKMQGQRLDEQRCSLRTPKR